MCDFSLQAIKSRAAAVGDKLVTRNFGSGTGGFADVNDLATAVCVLPGTEIAFADKIKIKEPAFFFQLSPTESKYSVAIFRQIKKDIPHTHHDALETPDGKVTLLTLLPEGQEATVLQLPAAPKTDAEREDQRRVETVS
jgi:hypothetical protein